MPSAAPAFCAYRIVADSLEVLLVHPGGPFWRNKDAGAWTIPRRKSRKMKILKRRRGGSSRRKLALL